MTLYQRLKDDSLAARKVRDTNAAATLTTVIGELQNEMKLPKNGGREPTDEDVIVILQKTLKNIAITQGTVTDPTSATALKLAGEHQLLSFYMPRQLNEAELSRLIDGIIAVGGAKNIGEVMKVLKLRHSGTYDGALASTILKRKFA